MVTEGAAATGAEKTKRHPILPPVELRSRPAFQTRKLLRWSTTAAPRENHQKGAGAAKGRLGGLPPENGPRGALGPP